MFPVSSVRNSLAKFFQRLYAKISFKIRKFYPKLITFVRNPPLYGRRMFFLVFLTKEGNLRFSFLTSFSTAYVRVCKNQSPDLIFEFTFVRNFFEKVFDFYRFRIYFGVIFVGALRKGTRTNQKSFNKFVLNFFSPFHPPSPTQRSNIPKRIKCKSLRCTKLGNRFDRKSPVVSSHFRRVFSTFRCNKIALKSTSHIFLEET